MFHVDIDAQEQRRARNEPAHDAYPYDDHNDDDENQEDFNQRENASFRSADWSISSHNCSFRNHFGSVSFGLLRSVSRDSTTNSRNR